MFGSSKIGSQLCEARLFVVIDLAAIEASKPATGSQWTLTVRCRSLQAGWPGWQARCFESALPSALLQLGNSIAIVIVNGSVALLLTDLFRRL